MSSSSRRLSSRALGSESGCATCSRRPVFFGVDFLDTLDHVLHEKVYFVSMCLCNLRD